MSLTFANPAGLFALLALPAIVAIHFLQQRSRTLRTSTLFLLDSLAPESRGGKTWQQLRSSRALWLQLLAALLVAWVLSAPRWRRTDSAQTVVVVLDSGASMAPFREDALRVVRERFAAAAARATHTQWIALGTDLRQEPFYQGPELNAALASLSKWKPSRGSHDPVPALRLAQTLAGASGLTWFVTDSREKAPPGERVIGVGRPIANVGFAGGAVSLVDAQWRWRVLVRNYTDDAQERVWTVKSGEVEGPRQRIELKANGLVELSGEMVKEGELVLRLESDAFPDDDCFPLVRPAAKPLAVAIELEGEIGDFFRRAVLGVDGAVLAAGAPAMLRVGSGAERPAGPAIWLAPSAAPAGKSQTILRAPVTPERNELVDNLNWQGWLGAGAGGLTPGPGDALLLWHNDAPLAWTSGGSDQTRQLVLNFDWTASNASRLPATVLLLQRFVRRVRDAQGGRYTANFDAQGQVAISAKDRPPGVSAILDERPVVAGHTPRQRTVTPAELTALRAPEAPGFFILRRGDETLVHGATQFADTRQADFRKAETFVTGPPVNETEAMERNTRGDPYVLVWLALLGPCLLASWWPTRGKARA